MHTKSEIIFVYFWYCDVPLNYRYSNFAIEKVVALNLFLNFCIVLLQVDCIGSTVDITIKSEKQRQQTITIRGERAINKRSKEVITKIRQSRLKAIILQWAIEKSLMMLSQYWINENLDSYKLFCILGAPIFCSPPVFLQD